MKYNNQSILPIWGGACKAVGSILPKWGGACKAVGSILPKWGNIYKTVGFLLIFLPLLSCSQVSPIQTLKIQNENTQFGTNLPAGTFIFNSETKQPYQLKKAANSTDSLSTSYLAVGVLVDTNSISVGGHISVLNTGNSVFIGEDAGLNDDLSDNRNVFVGKNAGKLNTTGNYNYAFGYNAFNSNTTGQSNVAIGSSAMTDNQIGTANTAVGNSALYQNTEGNYNTGFGHSALRGNSIGVNNVAIGHSSLYYTGNSNNTAIGTESGLNNNGSANIFLGYQAGYNEAGSNKLYIENSNSASPLIYGDFSIDSLAINGLTTIDSNLIVDGHIWQSNTGNSVFIGENAGATDDLTFNNNVFVGYESGKSVTYGHSNTFIGYESGELCTYGNNNTAVGYQSAKNIATMSGITAFGSQALFSAYSTSTATAIGRESMYNLTTGNYNTALGGRSLYSATNGEFNTAIGLNSMYFITVGGYNTALGYESLRSALATASYKNTVIGTQAGYNTTGSYNVFLGFQAGYHNTTGSDNIFIGFEAGHAETNSDRLYIENSNSTTPLIFGDFNLDQILINGDLTVTNKFLLTYSSTPTSATATGTLGEIRLDANYIYICTATNTWKRIAISTW